MKFEFDGKTYKLEFSRTKRNVKLIRDRRSLEVQSKYPYTTAKLYLLPDGATPVILGNVSVGCYKHDTFCRALGRKYALTRLSAFLKLAGVSKELRSAMWQAYFNRTATPVEDRTPIQLPPAESVPMLALPPAQNAAE